MALNELFEVTLDGSMQGQDVSNVYFYRQLDTFPAGLEDLRAQSVASAFVQQHYPKVRGISSFDVSFRAIRCRSLFTPSQNHLILLTDVGLIGNSGTQSLPCFNAVSFTMKGSNPAVRPGKKRYAGIAEDFNADGILQVVAPLSTALNALRDALSANLLDTLTQLIPWAAPVVIKRVRTGVPGAYEYRLPANAAEAVYSTVTSADYSLGITSQISRRPGKGS